MAGQAAYKAKISIGGTGVPVTDEACTMTSANNYQITDATRRIVDRYTVPTVYIDATPVDADLFFFNYLFGIVITDGAVTDGTMTIDYTYIPTTEVACANAFTLEVGGDILDDTCFKAARANNGFRNKIYGLNDISSTLESLAITDRKFSTAKIARNSVLMEWDFDGTGAEIARGWFVIESDNFTGEVSGLNQESISLQLEADDTENILRSFSFNT